MLHHYEGNCRARSIRARSAHRPMHGGIAPHARGQSFTESSRSVGRPVSRSSVATTSPDSSGWCERRIVRIVSARGGCGGDGGRGGGVPQRLSASRRMNAPLPRAAGARADEALTLFCRGAASDETV